MKRPNKLAALKDIRLEAPLSFLFEDLSSLSSYVKPFDAATFRLSKGCLPGPYALLWLQQRNSTKTQTIGVRISAHPVLEVTAYRRSFSNFFIAQQRRSFAKPDPDELLSDWDGKVDIVLQAGAGGNVPSTVIDLCQDPWEVIREGKGEIDFLA